MCGCLSHDPYWGPGVQPRHVPWLGIEPVTLGFAGWHSIHWATQQPEHFPYIFLLIYEYSLHVKGILKSFIVIKLKYHAFYSLNCTIQWLLVYSQNWPSAQTILEHFITLRKKNSNPLSCYPQSLHPSHSLATTILFFITILPILDIS